MSGDGLEERGDGERWLSGRHENGNDVGTPN
jgi:hypothetical protein